MGSTAEIKRLQSCINDLISVLALPAIWSGSKSSQILSTLLDVLLTMLRLDFAYARLNDASDGPPIEVVRLGDHRHSPIQPQQFGQALDRWLTADQTASRCVVPDPAGEGEVSIASFSLGLHHEVGVLVAGSRRADFPTEIERLLLRVAANQAGIGLQDAQRSGEQRRIAEMLEQRVAERTRQLTAANDDVRRSEAYLAEAQRLSRTGSFGWRPSTGEIIWSEETFRIFQYDRTATPTAELILQRVHPEDASLVKQTIERALQDGKNFEHEYRLLMPDGSVKHVHVVAHALSNESGSVERWSGDGRHRSKAGRRGFAPSAGGSRTWQPGDHHGRVDCLPGARSESADCRGRHRRQHLLALAYARSSRCGRGPPCCIENRQRCNPCWGNHQPNPPALQEGYSAMGVS